MAQGIQRDPLSIASGGLPGLFGTTFSPIPATEGDIAARSRAVVPQFGSAPVQILSTPTFRPTAQTVLPTPLLRRPEEVGRAAFRQIREEVQFPVLRPAETIEEIDNRLRSILPVIETAPPQQPVPGGSGSILEPPTPPPPPVVEPEAVVPVTPPPLPGEAMPVAPITAPPQQTPPPPPVVELGAVVPITPPEAMPVAPITIPPEQPPAPTTTISPVETTPPPQRPVITPIVPPQQTPPPPQPDNSLMQILQALTEPGPGIDRDYGPSFDRDWGYGGPTTAAGSFGSIGGGYTTPSFEVGERFDRFGDWGFDRYV